MYAACSVTDVRGGGVQRNRRGQGPRFRSKVPLYHPAGSYQRPVYISKDTQAACGCLGALGVRDVTSVPGPHGCSVRRGDDAGCVVDVDASCIGVVCSVISHSSPIASNIASAAAQSASLITRMPCVTALVSIADPLGAVGSGAMGGS